MQLGLAVAIPSMATGLSFHYSITDHHEIAYADTVDEDLSTNLSPESKRFKYTSDRYFRYQYSSIDMCMNSDVQQNYSYFYQDVKSKNINNR